MLTKKEVIAQLHNMGIDLTPPIHWPKSPKEQMVISLPIYKAKALGLAPNELLKIVTYGGKYGIEREAFSVAKRNPAIRKLRRGGNRDMGLYIGHIKTEGERPYLFSLFKSKKTPTRESHGLSYNYVSGPFKNQAEAVRAGLYQGHKPYGERTTEIAEQILMRKNPAGRKSVKFEIKDDHGRWLEVDEYVFRSWTGKRKLNGKPYRGTVHRLGSGKKNPAVREITSKSLPAMPYSFKPGIVEEIFVLAIAPKKIEKGWPVVWKIVDWSRLGVRKEHGSFTSDEVSRFVHEAVALMDRKKSQGKLKSVKHIVFVSHLAKEVTILKSY